MNYVENIIIFLTLNILYVLASKKCVPKDYGYGGTVCVCNANHCDSIDPLENVPKGEYIVYTSDKSGLRFEKHINKFSTILEDYAGHTIKIDPNIKYQTIFGFGGAFTDSFGINVKSLNENLQKELINSYFSDEGIEYSLCRVPIGGTDFSTRPYTYDDEENDINLKKFSLADEDYKYKIPLMQEALKLRKGNLKFLASPWSSPAWTKTNNALSGMGMMYKKYYQYWAEYYLKFLESYDQNNITIWGITTGNEPINGIIPFIKINSIGWIPQQQSHWIANNLGPTIRNSKFKDVKIICNDDQRFFLPWIPKYLFKNNDTKNFVDGIAVHWYWDSITPISAIQATHNMFPDKFILSSEACVGDKFYQRKVEPGSWYRGELYAIDIIDDLNNWVTAWIDWNMALNENGGPTYINNFVDSPILVNSTSQEFYKNPMYYVMGHFSKFVPAGSVRIHFDVNTNLVKVTAFKRPDEGIVIIILNRLFSNVDLRIKDSERGYIEVTANKHSINTIIFW